jgi:translation initiation factor IF-2
LPKKIRVYELARELGLTNKETVDLAVGLGIGVKSHSSSIEDAQADRVRRKADAEGLRREVQPEEPVKATKATKPAKAADPEPAAPATEAPVVAGEAAEAPPKRLVSSARPVAPKPAPPRAAAPTDAPPTTAADPVPSADPTAAAPRPAPAPNPADPGRRPAPTRPPLSDTGKPIPPPPRRAPMSPSGKPIPPPPGSRRPGGPAGAGARPGGPRPGGPRPGGFAGTGGPRPGGFGGGSGGPRPGGFGGGPGGPPAGRGGPPGRGGPRPPQRRSRRRRRNTEELEPTQMTEYVPSTAPVPEGEIIVERGSTARDLGAKLNRSAGDVIRFLLLQGEMVTATQSLTDDMMELFAAELGAEIRLVDPGEEKEAELLAKFFEEEEEEEEDVETEPRPPVVTVMGHVDHGKTLLLDKIRSANVVAGEAGGITQHIGAYQVEWNGHPITFIDTPGHEAFTAMRARGAQATDIVILVVAADDGVMPQTIEAIDHAKAAEVPIIVAVNKMDRENANPDRVLQQLSEHQLVAEKWGGDTIVVEVSALKGTGIDELLEQLVIVAEVEELRAPIDGRARGVVLEANLEVGRGPVATVIVQRGTLRVGDPIVAGAAWGKAKALIDDHGKQVKFAGPSTPVQVLGFSEPPQAGDEVRTASDLAHASKLGETRAQRMRLSGHLPVASAAGARLEDIFEQIQRGETATLNVVLKADVQGSLEACTESLRKLERDDVKLAFIRRGVGGINENDVQLAAASNATIIGFNVRPDKRSRDMASADGVEVRTYEIIYKLIEDIESAMIGMLAPEYEEVVTGEAEVREVFRIPRVGAIAGCMVREGTITRGSKVRFLREGTIIWKGAVNSLKRFKDDAREVQAGFECGIGLTDYQDLKEGDIIETFEEREIPRV